MEENREPRNKPSHLRSNDSKKVLRLFNEERTVSSENGTGKTGNPDAKEWNWTLTYATNTVNSKWIKDLNLRAKTIKIIEENIGQKLHNIGFANDFLDITPKAKATKVKRDELNYIEIKKKFVHQRTHKQNEKGNPWNRTRYVQIMYLTRSLMSRIYEEFLRLNGNKKQPDIKMGKGFE